MKNFLNHSIAATAMLACLAMPAHVAHAQAKGDASVSEKIRELQGIIASLEAQIAAYSAGHSNVPVKNLISVEVAKSAVFALDLKEGTKNIDVNLLQKILATDPDLYSGEVTGVLDAATKQGVIEFQERFFIEGEDGVVGTMTRAYLNMFLATIEPGVIPPRLLSRSLPIPYKIVATSSEPTRLNLSWRTKVPASANVYFATSTFAASRVQAKVLDIAKETAKKSVLWTSLSPHTKYYFIIQSKDAEGRVVTSPEHTFTTPAR